MEPQLQISLVVSTPDQGGSGEKLTRPVHVTVPLPASDVTIALSVMVKNGVASVHVPPIAMPVDIPNK